MFCRLCAIKLSESCIDILDETDKSLSKKIKTIFKIQVKKNDEYHKICLTCDKEVEEFFKYYETVQKTQKDLKRLKTSENRENVQILIPSDIKLEIEDNGSKTEEIIEDYVEIKIEPEKFGTTKAEGLDEEKQDLSDSECFDDGGSFNSESECTPKESLSKKEEYKEISEKINKFFNFTCAKCNQDLKNPFGYQLHMKRQHKVRNATITCCGEKIPSVRTKLLYHYYTHTNVEQLCCRVCSKQCSTMRYLRRHEKCHFLKKERSIITCPECGKQLRGKSSLKSHIWNIHTPKDIKYCYKCDLCEKSATSKTLLLKHFQQSHNMGNFEEKVEPILCPVCAKSFQTESGFHYHFKAHHDIEKVVCPECGQEMNKLSLKSHIRRQHDHIPQTCDICFKQFKNMHTMIHHKNRVHIEPRHECDMCKKKFKTKDKLLDHRKGHFVQNRFHCDLCNVTCNDYANMLKHRKQVHPHEPALPKGQGRKILEIGF
uniref:CSON010189 protein n=1 Tax=Culicoides sonorensis TaxID=179676 RepID=A0A336LL14_CULSO